MATDDTGLRLAKALHAIKAERVRLGHELKLARLEITRLRHAVVTLRRTTR